jgi:hypothetical protein
MTHSREQVQQHTSPELIPDESELVEAHEIELPRWVQVPIGVILSLFTLRHAWTRAAWIASLLHGRVNAPIQINR